MKKLILCAFLMLSVFTMKEAWSQVNIQVNIGSQPPWGPVGYDYVDYYYLPDIGVYYYVPRRQFIYFSGGHWVFSYHLPPAYRGYDLYRGYKVVINEPRAYRHYSFHREKYRPYRNHRSQVSIRHSDRPGYYRTHRSEFRDRDNSKRHGGWKNKRGDRGKSKGRH